MPGRRALQVSHLETKWINVRVSEGIAGEQNSHDLHQRIISMRDRALAWATKQDSPAIYKHSYSVGDLVIWDNYSTLHRAPAQLVVGSVDDAQARHMWRISVKGAPAVRLPRSDSAEWRDALIAEAYQSRL